MSSAYRIEIVGSRFIVIGPDGDIVNTFPTEDAAKQAIERCKKDDAMYETAKQIVDIAIKTHMERFGVDRETARYWIKGAAETTD